MGFWLELNEQHVLEYLRNLQGLSRQGRLRLFASLDRLRTRGDFYIQNAERTGAESDLFWFRVRIRDRQGDGRLRQFRFAVSDSAASFGVLRILYMDETTP